MKFTQQLKAIRFSLHYADPCYFACFVATVCMICLYFFFAAIENHLRGELERASRMNEIIEQPTEPAGQQNRGLPVDSGKKRCQTMKPIVSRHSLGQSGYPW